MDELDKQSDRLHNLILNAIDHEDYDDDFEEDLVYDVSIGEIPVDELAEYCVAVEFNHPHGPEGVYQLEQVVSNDVREWFDEAMPDEISDETQEYMIRKYMGKVQDKAEELFRDRKEQEE